ncbi:hypothetical protein ACFLZ5_05425 [Thermodesulfobacteriota bacterium]
MQIESILKKGVFIGTSLLLVLSVIPGKSSADPLPGGRLDPTIIPKYVIPLVIPPVMNNNGSADNYDISVREFKQQILPGGIWNTLNGRNDKFNATRIWSYGPEADPTPKVAPDPNSQFNYPAYTIETMSDVPVNVRWINGWLMKRGSTLIIFYGLIRPSIGRIHRWNVATVTLEPIVQV